MTLTGWKCIESHFQTFLFSSEERERLAGLVGEGGGERPERSQTRGTGNMDRESQVLTPFVHKLRIQYEWSWANIIPYLNNNYLFYYYYYYYFGWVCIPYGGYHRQFFFNSLSWFLSLRLVRFCLCAMPWSECFGLSNQIVAFSPACFWRNRKRKKHPPRLALNSTLDFAL